MYDYERDSGSKEAYMYVSTCVDIRIGGDKFQCNHVHGVRVDDMRVQGRYTCSSEYREKCPEIRILVLGPTTPPTTHGRPTSNLLPAPLLLAVTFIQSDIVLWQPHHVLR